MKILCPCVLHSAQSVKHGTMSEVYNVAFIVLHSCSLGSGVCCEQRWCVSAHQEMHQISWG